MNAVSFDISVKLVAAGLGTSGGVADWAIYRGEEPTTPNKVTTLYDTPGPPPGYFMNVAVAETQYPTFQVRVRAEAYSDAEAKAEAIKNYLNTVEGWFVGDIEYGRPFQTSTIFSLGKDAKGLSRVVVNFKIIRQDGS